MTIAVTSGDPSGIGPEIVQKSWIYLKNKPSNEFFWIGEIGRASCRERV